LIDYAEVILYEQEDKEKHKIYFSKSNTRFKIEGRTFVLTKKQSKKITEIISDNISKKNVIFAKLNYL
jgi:hypothetical protein